MSERSEASNYTWLKYPCDLDLGHELAVQNSSGIVGVAVLSCMKQHKSTREYFAKLRKLDPQPRRIERVLAAIGMPTFSWPFVARTESDFTRCPNAAYTTHAPVHATYVPFGNAGDGTAWENGNGKLGIEDIAGINLEGTAGVVTESTPVKPPKGSSKHRATMDYLNDLLALPKSIVDAIQFFAEPRAFTSAHLTPTVSGIHTSVE